MNWSEAAIRRILPHEYYELAEDPELRVLSIVYQTDEERAAIEARCPKALAVLRGTIIEVIPGLWLRTPPTAPGYYWRVAAPPARKPQVVKFSGGGIRSIGIAGRNRGVILAHDAMREWLWWSTDGLCPTPIESPAWDGRR